MLVVQGLHTAGANLSPVDGFGGTPLSDAIRNGHLEVARLLIKHEAQVEMPDDLLQEERRRCVAVAGVEQWRRAQPLVA